MKTLAFILIRKAVIGKIEWASLIGEEKAALDLVLISEKGGLKILRKSNSELGIFTEMYEVESLEFEPVKSVMDKVLGKHYQEGAQLRIATLHEFHILLAAELREHYRQEFNAQAEGPEIIEYFRNKPLMKKALAESDLRIPGYAEFDPVAFKEEPEVYLRKLEQSLPYPLFVKPIDGAGSMNTAFIPDKEALKTWCNKVASSDNTAQKYEIDEFIAGDLFHCDWIIQDGKPLFPLVSKYLHPNADALSGKALASMTLDPDSADYEGLKNFAYQALKAFPHIPDGLTHMEIFKNQQGEYVFLEVAARPPGGEVRENYKIRYGIDIFQIHLRLHLGLKVDHMIEARKEGPFAAMFQVLTPSHGGKLTQLQEPDFIGGSNCKTQFMYQIGDELPPPSSVMNILASTVFWHENYSRIEQDFSRLDQQEIFSFESASAKNTSEEKIFFNTIEKKRTKTLDY